MEELLWSTGSDDAAGLEKNDARGEQQGFTNVVSDEDDGLAEPANEFAELSSKFGAGNRVERAEGLVHQQNGWVGSEGAGYANALALAAGELVRAAGGEFVRIETDKNEEFFDAFRNASRLPFFQFGNQTDILCDGEVREQSAFLNNVPDAAAQANGIPLGGKAALDQHVAGLGR